MSEVQKLLGHEEWSNKKTHTQVFLATHDGADRRLPHRERSFISFTYGGKFIEDFSLIATVKGDRMERTLYGDFSDNTSTYDVIDGQFYWGTHFTTNKLELLLSTDEITELELLDFKSWFKPGEGRELILAEYPNRAIWARINSVPEYHMLPFEKKVTTMFAGIPYEISTTVYRGNIDLEFVMDDPFWYSIYNVLPSYGQDGAANWFRTLGIDLSKNVPAKDNSLMANKDYLKVILEDGVPTKEMFQIELPVITGNEIHNISEKPMAVGQLNNLKVGNAKVGGMKDEEYITGSRLFNISIELSSLGAKQTAYLYYTGSAPAPTILRFDLTPYINDNNYISQPWNKIYNKVAVNSGSDAAEADYNTITVGKLKFKFTTPSLYTGYNLALDIISSDAIKVGTSTIDLHILLNEGVNEYYSRSWALGILNYIKAFLIGVDILTSLINDKKKFEKAFSAMMKRFLQIKVSGSDDFPNYSIKPASFEFNSKTGLSTGKFYIRKFTTEGEDAWDKLAKYKDPWNVSIHLKYPWIVNTTEIENESSHYELTAAYKEENSNNIITDFDPISNDSEEFEWKLLNTGFDMLADDGTILFTVKPFMEYTKEDYIEENVGDMVYGKYLYLNEKNLYNIEDGYIRKENCTLISTDYPKDTGGLLNFDIQYKHMYL